MGSAAWVSEWTHGWCCFGHMKFKLNGCDQSCFWYMPEQTAEHETSETEVRFLFTLVLHCSSLFFINFVSYKRRVSDLMGHIITYGMQSWPILRQCFNSGLEMFRESRKEVKIVYLRVNIWTRHLSQKKHEWKTWHFIVLWRWYVLNIFTCNLHYL
jgi:hypothetical protein